MRMIAFAAAMMLAAPAFAADDFSVVIDGRTSTASIRLGAATLARADLPYEVLEKYAPRRQREAVYMPCGYNQYCAVYPAYADHGTGNVKRVLEGQDIAFRDVDLPLKPVAQQASVSQSSADDVVTDQWMNYYQSKKQFDRNPAGIVSSAALYDAPDAVVNASLNASGKGTVISISRRGAAAYTADIQRLLNQMGFEAGPVDGKPGPATEWAIASFEYYNGMEPRGRITPRLVKAVFRAARAKMPADARLTITRDGQMVVDENVALKDTQKPLGLHVLVADDESDGQSTGQWRALGLTKGHKTANRFLFSSEDPAAALQRITISEKAQAALVESVGPGSVLIISDQPAPEAGQES